jgi:D-xylose transport system permease protein
MSSTSESSSTSTAGPEVDGADQTIAPDADDVALRLNPEATANTLGEYLRAWVLRIRNGDSGMLPVIGGLIFIVIVFQVKKPIFLSAGNLTNLFTQSATYILFGMAEVFVLLLGEIDLSIGYVGGVSAVVAVATAAPPGNHPWWVAILAGLVVGTLIGALQGALITYLRVPSFVVTLAGLLGWEGALITLANREGGQSGGGSIRVTNKIMTDLVYGNLSVTAGWVLLVVGVAAFGSFILIRDSQRRRHNLVVAPVGVAVLRIVVVAAAGVALVAICNTNRGRIVSHPVEGVPWVILVVLGTFAVWTALLGRTRFGRYIYAIGGNAEAARRAGINLTRIRVAAFTLTGLTAALAGIVLSSQLGSISSNVDGGQLVLYAVAAAVIGGTSLFGGRGRMLYALVGGLVIATIANGMGLIGLRADQQYMVTAGVLLLAATVDALGRRNAGRGR